MTDKLAAYTKRFIIAYSKFTGGFVDMAPKWAQDRLALLAYGKLPAFPEPELVAYTRAHRNTVRLIEYLRRIARVGINNAPVLDPVLATLIADALEKGWKKGKSTYIELDYLRRLRDNIKEMLKEGDQDAERLARELGATSKKANHIAAHLLGLPGPSAFDRLLYPRVGRNKKG